MQIQKGLVKYKDRSDIVCTYGLTEDGKQYYFLDNSSMSNGNIIASTVLVEAIDPVVVASSVGVIDANGTVVIPFENKSIKPIAEGLLLVEVANSTTPSVVEANSLRSDPLAATKLVTTPATIKDKINAKMGSEGRFVFNDQFSEATICDYNGNNILDNQYFSFIAIKNNDTLYMCKNTADSEVMEYSLVNRMFVARNGETVPLDVQSTMVTQETIDGAMSAEKQVVSVNPADITEKDFQTTEDGFEGEEPLPVEPSVVNPEQMPVVPAESTVPQEEIVAEEVVAEDDDGEEPLSVIPAAINPESVSETEETEEVSSNDVVSDSLQLTDSLSEEPVTETPNEVVEIDDPLQLDENLVTDSSVAEVPAVSVEEPLAEEVPTSIDEFDGMVVPEENIEEQTGIMSDNVVPQEQEEPEANVEPTVPIEQTDNDLFAQTEEVVDSPVNEEVVATSTDELMDLDFSDNINYSAVASNAVEPDELSVDDVVSDFKSDLFETDLDTDIFADSALQADKIDISDSYSDFSYKMPEAKDSIIEDVASTMSNLIRQNKTQKQTIATYEEKMSQAAAAYKKVVDKARSQLRDVEILKNKLKNYETIVTKLEAKLQVLENKVHDQDKVIASQTRELESLRPQVEGKEELVRILADAQNLLDQSM